LTIKIQLDFAFLSTQTYNKTHTSIIQVQFKGEEDKGGERSVFFYKNNANWVFFSSIDVKVEIEIVH